MSAAQLHLLLVHLPVLACPAAAALLIASRIAANETLLKTACVTLVLGTLAATGAYFSGPPAYESLQLAPGPTRELVEAHAALGKGAFMGLVLLGLAALLALLQYPQGERPAPWLRWTLLAASLLLAWLLAWTAHQGGLIRHEELRALRLPLFPRL
ncbi:MAG: hypothetical protein R3C71_11745 [Candidatus Krumholzibacteriia bacterium]|nr:hypothetical protein [bacterium]MCB9516603.1 hypothetical protein [Candidatus Latescibacterota bacterium]